MRRKYSNSKLADSHYKIVLMALGIFILCIVLGGMLVTTLMISNVINEDKMNTITMIVIFAAAFVGSLSIRLTKGEGRCFEIFMLMGTAISLIVIINILCFGARFHDAIRKVIGACVGCAIMNMPNKAKKKKYKV